MQDHKWHYGFYMYFEIFIGILRIILRKHLLIRIRSFWVVVRGSVLQNKSSVSSPRKGVQDLSEVFTPLLTQIYSQAAKKDEKENTVIHQIFKL